MARDPVDRWRDLGSFIREQRSTARLSLRRLSELAGISNPYLSQIERGLRRPSADILQQIAKALRISAETLYVQAGILDPPTDAPDLVHHILAEPHLDQAQKQALVEIYLSFRRAHNTDQPNERPSDPPYEGPGPPYGGPDAPGPGARTSERPNGLETGPGGPAAPDVPGEGGKLAASGRTRHGGAGRPDH